jgi:uncharacterized protein (DUF1330 family)
MWMRVADIRITMGVTMPAYLIAEHLVRVPEIFEEYKNKVVPMIERYGGRYLTRGGSHEILDGTWNPTRVVIVEFPDMATLRAWFESPEYQPLIELRRRAGTDVVMAIDGV